ncbi:MAG: heparinase II/III family protein, partial [Candidatus Kapabacteria bacterium]|nr:heparinase II/III family protein [Candidatus Kapabacteria bacterium]
MVKYLVILFVLVFAAAAQDGTWLPVSGHMQRPRILLTPKDSSEIVQLLSTDNIRRGLCAEVTLAAFAPVPTGNTSSAERRARATLAKNIAFVLYTNVKVEGGQVVPLTQQEQALLQSNLRELLSTINTSVEEITLTNLSAYDEWQWRTKELIDYCAAFDIYKAIKPQSADSIYKPLHVFASHLFTESTRNVVGFHFFDIVKNNHALMTAGALGVAAVALGEYGSASSNEQPARWMETSLYVIDNVMWNDTAAQSTRGVIAGYAEGPYYFRYAMLNCFPLFRALYNAVPDTTFTAKYLTGTTKVRHPYFDTDYANLYFWIDALRMPNGCLPPIGDTYVNTAFPELHLVGEYINPQSKNWISFQLQSTVDMRANYLCVRNGILRPMAVRYITALNNAGSIIFTPHISDTYVHIIAKNGRARTSGAGHSQSDAASFMLYGLGETLALDPGYISYARRNEVGKATNHNSILVDGTGPPNGAPLAPGGSDANITTSFMYGAKHFGLANVQTSYNGATISRTFFMLDNGRVGIADVIKSTSPHTYTWQLHGNGIIDGSVQQGNATVTIDTNKAMGVWNVNKSKLFAQVSGTHFTNARAEHAVHETGYNDTAEHTVLRCDTRKSTRGSFGAILTTSIGNEIPQFDIYNSDQYTSYTHQQNDSISDVFFVRDTTGTDKEIIYNGPFSSITTDAECGYLQYENYRGTALLFNVASGYIPLIAYFESDKNVSLAMSTVEGTKQFLNGYVNQPCKIFFRPSAWIPEYGYKLTNVSGDSIESVY